MLNFGSLYYELFLNDLTDRNLKAIEDKLKNLGIELDTTKLTESLKKFIESYKGKYLALGVKTQYLHDAIRSALKQPEFPIKITVNKAEAKRQEMVYCVEWDYNDCPPWTISVSMILI